jgi:hypothetical protein
MGSCGCGTCRECARVRSLVAGRIRRGEALPAEPVRRWALWRQRVRGLSVEQLAAWGECDARTIRKLLAGEALTVDVAVADRLFTREGSTSLSVYDPLRHAA